MAAPITHIVLTNKIFDKYFKDKKKKDFLIGTSLPDIRYLKNIERDKTHFGNITLNEIKKEHSFIAGLKFHSLLDMIREKFIVSQDIYYSYPELKYLKESLKLLEDDTLYGKINNWKEITNFFDKILEEELNLGIQRKDTLKWHKILQKYLSQQPDKNTRNILLTDMGFSEVVAKEINENIEEMKKDQKTIQVINELYNNFESILIDFEKPNKSFQ